MIANGLRYGAALLALAFLGTGCASLSAPNLPLVNSTKKLNAQMAVARMQEQQGDIGSAKKFYEEVVRKHPKHAEAHQRLGVIAVRQGKAEAAEMHFVKARELAPADPKILNDLGYFYFLENRLDDAEPVLRELLELDPLNSRALNNLGLVLGFQNRPEEAFAHFRKVGSDAEAHANLAFVFAHLGELDKAQMHYSFALSHNPKMKSAARALLEIARVTSTRPPGVVPPDDMEMTAQRGAPPHDGLAGHAEWQPHGVEPVAHLAPVRSDLPPGELPGVSMAGAPPMLPYDHHGGFAPSPASPPSLLQPLPPVGAEAMQHAP